MHLTRERRRRLLVAGSVVGVVLLFAAFLAWRVAQKHPEAGADQAVPLRTSPTVGPKSVTTPAAKRPVKIPDGLPASFGSMELGPGLAGGSSSNHLPRHRIVLSAFSSQPMAFVAYYVPTSQDHEYGNAKLPGKSWSMETVVYGRPDYAQMYLQTTAYATPVTCTITVDGKVTARETTEGPYGTILCQG